MIENPCARAPYEIVHGSAQRLRRKHFHRHTVVLVKHARILNPERKLWRPFLANGFTIKNRAGHAGTMAAGMHKVANVVCVLPGRKQ